MLTLILKAMLYGVVEGVTEWLPVSSTGHMILLGSLVRFDGASDGFADVFEVVVQLGAALAVAVHFRERFAVFRRDTVGRLAPDRSRLALWGKVAVACVPVVAVGLTLDDFAEAHFHNPASVAIALAAVGAAFIAVERVRRGKAARVRTVDALGVGDALVIGVFQAIAAIFPGTSRSGATILGGLCIGVDRGAAAEFTFLAAVPVMAGASILRLAKSGLSFTAAELAALAAGTITAFLVSLGAIRFLVGFVRRHDFTAFGVYRVALGAAVLVMTAVG